MQQITFPDLPIKQAASEIKQKLDHANILILSAETGAGKSTLTPLLLLDETWLSGKKIIMLEPRRIAARAIAERISEITGTKLGTFAGFRTGLLSVCSRDARIEIVTEGVFTRMLQRDPALEHVGMVIFDEFHERNIHADLGLTLLLAAQPVFRSDLRVIIMSATLNHTELQDFLSDAERIFVKGRSFPVSVIYSPMRQNGILENEVAAAIYGAVQTLEGDILVFLPGEKEIRKSMEQFHDILKKHGYSGDEIEVVPLYGNLSSDAQHDAIHKDERSKRRIILSTSLAETSLTIPDIRVVIDSGYTRKQYFSASSEMNVLETVRISKSIAEQRRGRAGRTQNGVCIRLWNETEQQALPDSLPPEILDCDLTPLALELAVWGEDSESVKKMQWMTCPPQKRLDNAFSLLRKIECISEDGRITEHGKNIAEFPLHPRIAHAVMKMQKKGNGFEAACFAAVLSDKNFLKDHQINVCERIKYFNRNYKPDNIDFQIFSRVAASRDRICAILQIPHRQLLADTASDCFSEFLLTAFPDRIAKRKSDVSNEYILPNGKIVRLPKEHLLLTSEFLIVTECSGENNAAGTVFGACPVSLPMIKKHLSVLIRRQRQIFWDTERECVAAVDTESIESVVLSRKPCRERLSDEESLPLLFSVIRKNGLEQTFEWSKNTRSFINRVEFLRNNGFHHFPDFSENALMDSLEEWLAPFCRNFTKMSEIKHLQIRQILETMISYEDGQKLKQFAPEKFTVPSGSSIMIDYSDVKQPRLSVKLQELFGLLDTPKLAGEKIPLQLDILSPAMRTIQRTSDLKSFWNESYYLVRKDMRGRYPKHDWPENPLEAIAHKGVKRTAYS